MHAKCVLLFGGVFLLSYFNIRTSFGYEERKLTGHTALAEIKGACEEQFREELTRVAQQPTSNICQTPSMICVLSQSGAVGTPCWCIGPSGPIKGVLVAPMR
jgi:hypothetical protein